MLHMNVYTWNMNVVAKSFHGPHGSTQKNYCSLDVSLDKQLAASAMDEAERIGVDWFAEKHDEEPDEIIVEIGSVEE